MPSLAAEVGSTLPGGGEPYGSAIFAPLLIGEETKGVITIQSEEEHTFNDSDFRLLTTLASSLSVALENARLFDEAQRRAREMSALTEVGRDISATLDLPTVLKRIANHGRDLLAVRDCAVFLPDASGQHLQAVVALGPIAAELKSHTIVRGEGIMGDIWQRGKAEMINDASNDPRAVQIPGTQDQSDEKMMVVPLLSGDTITGMMAVWRSGETLFNEQDLRFLEGLARQAAIAIANAHLFAKRKRRGRRP